MRSLYSLEDNDSESGNDLLIDKILKANQKEKSPLSLTADVLKERQQLKDKVLDVIADKDTSSDEDTSKDNDEEEQNEEDKEDEGGDIVDEVLDEENKDDSEDSEDKDSNDTKDDKEDSDKEDKDTKEDTSDKDKEDSKDKDKKDKDKKEDKDSFDDDLEDDLSDFYKSSKKVSKESLSYNFRPICINLRTNKVFNPVYASYTRYTSALESYSLTHRLAIEEQPIVYVAEAVKESLNNLVSLANTYIANNTKFIKDVTLAVKSLNERFTIYTQYVTNNKFTLTNKLINDKDVIINLSIPNKSDIRTTIKVLDSYINDSTNAVLLVINNAFEDIESGYLNNNYEKAEGDISYKAILPGFNLVKLHIDPYTNYLKTKIENFHYYKLKVFKPEDIFSLNAITIEEKDLNYILEVSNRVIGKISLIIDNLSIINTNFTKFIDEIKVIIYDIENNKYKDIKSVGIDAKVQDFIRFKMAIEESIIDINVIIDYLTSLETVLNEAVKLKE